MKTFVVAALMAARIGPGGNDPRKWPLRLVASSAKLRARPRRSPKRAAHYPDMSSVKTATLCATPTGRRSP